MNYVVGEDVYWHGMTKKDHRTYGRTDGPVAKASDHCVGWNLTFHVIMISSSISIPRASPNYILQLVVNVFVAFLNTLLSVHDHVLLKWCWKWDQPQMIGVQQRVPTASSDFTHLNGISNC